MKGEVYPLLFVFMIYLIMDILLLRHAPKDNTVKHITGMEAQLTSNAVESVNNFVNSRDFSSYKKICIHTSPVQRAKDTASMIYEKLNDVYAVNPVIVMNNFGSYEEIDGEVKNLVSPEMSKLWGEAKSKAKDERDAEHSALLSWCKVGYFETFNDTGISLNDMCERMQNYILNLKQEDDILHIIISHSGDIEPYIYWLISKERGLNLEDNPMVDMFNEFGGAVHALDGYQLKRLKEGLIFINQPQ